MPDGRSTHFSYMRRHAAAAQHLTDALDSLPEGSPEGYVGEWHTHPAPQGPSRTDRNQLKQISKQCQATVALIVLAHDPATGQWEPRGLCGRSGGAGLALIEIRPPRPKEHK